MSKRRRIPDYYDPRLGSQGIRLSDLRIGRQTFDPPRTNYFTVCHIETGRGEFWSDASRFSFYPSSLLFFVPYQQIRFVPHSPVQGAVIHFHANFLCVETFHAEVGCSGVLFNDPQGVPIVPLDERATADVSQALDSLRREWAERDLAFQDVMLAQLKVLLILASRLKSSARVACGPAAYDPRHPTLMEFRDAIEAHYRRLHAPADYARLLHVTPKTLGRIVRENLGATPTELIRARIMTHAKWHLLHTLKPVKEVARELGFADELYFSRLFKKATGCSPTFFREFETLIRNGSNLSMFFDQASIPAADAKADTASQSNISSKSTGK